MTLQEYVTNLRETLDLLTNNPLFQGTEFDAARLAVNQDLQHLQHNAKTGKAKSA